MDRQSVFALSVFTPDHEGVDDSRTQIESQLREFVLEFRLDNAFIYRCVYHFHTVLLSLRQYEAIKFDRMY